MDADIIDVVMFEALESTHVEHDHYQYNFGITQHSSDWACAYDIFQRKWLFLTQFLKILYKNHR